MCQRADNIFGDSHVLFNFFRVGGIIAKKINHRGHEGHRELLFSLCPLCSLWFSEPIPEDNKKSHSPVRSEIESITGKSGDDFSGSYVSQLAIIDRHQAVTITLGSEGTIENSSEHTLILW